jgi:hypothetical protein
VKVVGNVVRFHCIVKRIPGPETLEEKLESL